MDPTVSGGLTAAARAWQQPQAPGSLPGPSVGRHLSRAVDWNVREIEVTPASGAAWSRRRARAAIAGAVVLAAQRPAGRVPVLVLTVVLKFVEAWDVDTSSFTTLGTLCVWLPPMALLLAPLGALYGIHRWTEVRGTSKSWCRRGDCRSSFRCYLLVPIDQMIDLAGVRAQVAGTGAEQALEQIIQAAGCRSRSGTR